MGTDISVKKNFTVTNSECCIEKEICKKIFMLQKT